MEKFIGIKIIYAVPMNRADYNHYRGWELPKDENGDDEGFLVEYADGGQTNDERHEGYISWSPAFVFSNAYRKTIGLTFGLAVEAMKKGLKVARSGWNGKGMFAYIVPAGLYPARTAAIKSHFGEDSLIPYRQYLALKTAQEDVATWAPSGSDALAEDWEIVE